MSIRKDTINLEIRINGENSGKTMRQLTATASQLKREMRELDPASQAFANKAKELQRVNTTLSDISASTRGVSRGFASSTNSVVTFLAAYAGIGAMQAFGLQLFDQIKKLNSLDQAYKLLIPETEKRARADEFLTGLAKNYGLELTKLRDEYIKYNASAKASNLALADQELVFESVAKAGAVLGLSTETQSRAFTALQQIMSKGKVSAEELKGQLGDALPGAVTIMAKALGVGTGELQKMLERGEVMADDALPKFARELQKAYGVDQVKTIDNISSAQNRFKNTFSEIVSEIGERAAPLIIQGFDLLSKLVGILFAFVNVLIAIPGFVKENRVAIGSLIVAIISLNTATIASTGSFLASQIVLRGITIATNAYTLATKGLSAAMKANPIGFVIAALSLLIGVISTAYQRSETFRGALDGLANFAKEFFKIILEGFQAFGKGFSLLKDGQFTEAFKSFGTGLTKLNPVSAALTEGKRLGAAFNKGFKDSLKKSADDKEAKDLLAQNAKIQNELATGGTGTGGGGGTTGKAGTGKPTPPEDRTGLANNLSSNDLISLSLKARQEALKASQKVLADELDKELDLLQTSKNLGELTEEQYGLAVIDIKRKGKEDELLLLTQYNETETNGYRDKYNELLELNAAFADTSAKQRFDLLAGSFTNELSTLEAQYLQGLLTEEEYQNARLELKKFYIEQELALLQSNGLSDTETFRNKELEKLRIQKEISDQSIALKKKEADIKREIETASFGAFNAFVDLAIEASNRETGTRKKNAELIKQFEKARILVNLYAEISGYYKAAAGQGPLGIALAVVQSITAAARAAIGISKVNSQKFKYGGLLDGPSHTHGGIPITMGGVQAAEAEGGEAFINKRSTAAFRPILSAINSFNGWGRKFETGGVLPGLSISPSSITAQSPTSSLQSSTLERKFEALIDLLGQGLDVRAAVVYTDIEAKSNTINSLRAATRT